MSTLSGYPPLGFRCRRHGGGEDIRSREGAAGRRCRQRQERPRLLAVCVRGVRTCPVRLRSIRVQPLAVLVLPVRLLPLPLPRLSLLQQPLPLLVRNVEVHGDSELRRAQENSWKLHYLMATMEEVSNHNPTGPLKLLAFELELN